MLEVFHKAHVRDLQAHAPGTGVGQIVVVEVVAGAPGQVAVAHEGREVARAGDGGQPLGTVLDVAVVTGGIPAEDAGGAPVHLVFHQGLDQPAFTLAVAAHQVRTALEHVVAAHGFHIAVVDVEFDVQGIQGRDGHGQTGPEHGAVGLAGLAEGKLVHAGQVAGQGHVQRTVGGLHAAFIEAGVLALHAVHGPGGQFHTVELQGQHEREEVHVVQVVLLVIFPVAIDTASIIVVERAHPEGGQAHVVVELVAGDHGGGVTVHDGGTAGHVGHGHGLQAHAELEVGIGHHPVDVGILDLHLLAVGTQGAAAFGIAPHLVADLEEHRTGQGFGGHGIQLQADALTGIEGILVMAFLVVHILDKAAVTKTKAHQPFAGGFEIDGFGAAGGPQEHAGSQHEGKNFFHDLLPYCLRFTSIRQQRRPPTPRPPGPYSAPWRGPFCPCSGSWGRCPCKHALPFQGQ